MSALSDLILSYTPRVYFPMDDASGFLQDLSGNNLDMTVEVGGDFTYEVVSGVPTAIGKAVRSVDGGETVQYRTVASTATTLTASFFAKAAATSPAGGAAMFANGRAVSTLNGWTIYWHRTGGTVRVYAPPNGEVLNVAHDLTAWSHIAFRANGAALSLFINGVEVDTATQAITTPTDRTQLFGDTRTGATSYFDGEIAHAAIFHSALTDEHIAAISNGGLNNDFGSLRHHDSTGAIMQRWYGGRGRTRR